MSRFLLAIFLFVFASDRLLMAQGTVAPEHQNQSEQVYLFTDRPSYFSGEVIWYSIFVAMEPGNRTTDLSNAVYAELTDSLGIISSCKLLLKDGACNGAFEIPENLPSGEYTFRAITSAMVGTVPLLPFQKTIRIANYQALNISSGESDPVQPDTVGDPGLKIVADRQSYSRRDKVSLDIAVTAAGATRAGLVVSVYKIDSEMEDHSVAVQVQNAYAPLNPLYAASEPFYSYADEHYVLDNYTRFNTMPEVFREYVKGVGMGITNRNNRLFVFDQLTRAPFAENAFVLLDGAPANNIRKLMAVDPLKIRSIDVVTHKYFFGRDVYYGIIDLRSYNGDMAGYEPDAIDTSASYERIAPQRIFMHPQYVSAEEKASRHPDFRNVLYWQPDLKTDTHGAAHVEFYSSDLRGRFLVSVRSKVKGGQMGRSAIVISVE